MPSSWIWMQTNHFDRVGISLSGSIAKIPWLGNYFTGYIFGFLYDKKLYEFTTYLGAKVTGLDVTDDSIRIRLENKVYRLDINADRPEGVELPAPRLGEMTAKVNESLRSSINVTLLTVLHQPDQKIIYPHYDFKHLTEQYFEIGMKLDDFLIQLVKYCIKEK